MKEKIPLWLKKILFNLFNTIDDFDLFQIRRSYVSKANRGKYLAAFSVYGTSDIYTRDLESVIQSYKKFLPDFDLVFFIGSDVPENVIVTLQLYDCSYHLMNRFGVNSKYMFWRFLAADFTFYEAVIIRDVDSVASSREETLVNAWLDSSKGFHIVRDHPEHLSRIMGGLWGIKPVIFEINFLKVMRQFKKTNCYGCDQVFLEKTIYPLIKESALIHDFFHVFPDETVEIIEFREGESFLGERIFNTVLNERDRDIFIKGLEGSI